MTDRKYKVVPIDVNTKSNTMLVKELHDYLTSNLTVKLFDEDFERAAILQQHLDTLDLLIAHSRDRLDLETPNYQ